jgi:hypothetical protein
MRDDTSDHQAVKRLRPKLEKSLRRPEMKRLVQAVQQGIEPAPFFTWSGLYAGTCDAYDVDLERLSAVAARTAKGLFHHETGYPLPSGYAVIAAIEPFANAQYPDELAQRAAAVLSLEPKVIGDNVFSYRCLFLKNDLNSSQWYFEFFETMPALCMTIKEEDLRCDSNAMRFTSESGIVQPVRFGLPRFIQRL